LELERDILLFARTGLAAVLWWVICIDGRSACQAFLQTLPVNMLRIFRNAFKAGLICLMARSDIPPDFLEALADDLARGADALKASAALLRESGKPSALLHGSSAKNVYFPAVLDWIEKTNTEVKIQVRAYLSDVTSKAEFNKNKSAKQAVAAAKKPWPKKAAKKKPPA
jgi:hypothetical protein